ncbi:hypothetical protein FB45DRAFT_930513 [Roridomyces roridus]|uniref:F-box domain-containing protein n=1 Tax=Roridomyces roridus TaxID=1738132 RepID=A0AAD7FGT3_9AGAR|nr:hypothetical protein FB45DRAFT_930513 [Roridomyces roridus]
MHPIHHIPCEILSEIFVQCLPSEYFSADPSTAPLVLAAVGSDWRRLSIATPRLWSRISLPLLRSLGDNSGIIQMFQCWLARSGGCPLSIDAFCLGRSKDNTPNSIPPVLLHALNECSSRWQEVKFMFSADDFRRLQAKNGLPLLRKLDVTVVGSPPEIPLTIFGNAPAIRVVQLGGGVSLSNFTFPMGQLRCIHTPSLSVGQFIHILREATNLVEFGTCVDVMETLPTSRTDVQAGNLRSLSLYLPDPNWINLLDSLTCPTLETLTLKSYGYSPIPANHLSRFISRSPLRFLSIGLPRSEAALNDLPECLSAAPRLEELSIKYLGQEPAYDLFRRMSIVHPAESHSFLPFLHTLIIGVRPQALYAQNRNRDRGWTYEEVLPMLVNRWNVHPAADAALTSARLRAFHLDVTDLDKDQSPTPSPPLKLPKRGSVVFAQMQALVAEGMRIWIDEEAEEECMHEY